MRQRTTTIVLIAIAVTLGSGAALADPTAATATKTTNVTNPETPPPPPPPEVPCRLFTIQKGAHSGFGFESPGFAGADLVIRDPHAWHAFWEHHNPYQPEPPMVDFRYNAVIASVQGIQPTGGGPNITVVGVEQDGPFARIVIVDDNRQGDLEIITNPFHIVTIPRACVHPRKTVVFQHVRPMPETSVIEGRVVTENPQGDLVPVPEAHVQIASPDGNIRATMAGGDGSFFFLGAEPGEYELRAANPGFEPFEMPLEVPPNTYQHVQVLLVRQPAEFGVIVGHVAAAHEGELRPLPGAELRLIREGEVVREAVTNDDGHYEMPEVEPGEYQLVATHPEFEPAEAPVFVEPGQVVERNFVLHPLPPQPGSFAGLVLGITDNGQHIPLGGALVRLFRENHVVAHAETNDDGHFFIEDVPPGEFIAVAVAPGWHPADMPVEIIPGELTEVVFHLEQGPPPPPEAGIFVGAVLGITPDGEVPLPRALVRIMGPDGLMFHTRTNQEGHFRIEHIPAGVYHAVAAAWGWIPAETEIEIIAGEPTEYIFHLEHHN